MSIDFDKYGIRVNFEMITCFRGKMEFSLGQYKTCERAKEVFREIHEKYMGLPFDDEANVFYMPEV